MAHCAPLNEPFVGPTSVALALANRRRLVYFRRMPPWLMALTICATLLGAEGLFGSITRILLLLRESEVARLPAASEADVMFHQAGSHPLHVDHPRFNIALLHAHSAVHDD